MQSISISPLIYEINPRPRYYHSHVDLFQVEVDPFLLLSECYLQYLCWIRTCCPSSSRYTVRRCQCCRRPSSKPIARNAAGHRQVKRRQKLVNLWLPIGWRCKTSGVSWSILTESHCCDRLDQSLSSYLRISLVNLCKFNPQHVVTVLLQLHGVLSNPSVFIYYSSWAGTSFNPTDAFQNLSFHHLFPAARSVTLPDHYFCLVWFSLTAPWPPEYNRRRAIYKGTAYFPTDDMFLSTGYPHRTYWHR